jgi:succinoglycan biosynthesis transport protein ExoP
MRVASAGSARIGADLSEQQAPLPNIHTLKGVLRRRWYVLLLIPLVPVAALAFSLAQEEKYTATASILFRDIGGSSTLASEDPEREAATNVELLSQGTVKARAERRLGDETADEVKIAQEGQSNLLNVTATDPSPEAAARTANTYAAEYVRFRRQAELRELRAEMDFVREALRDIPVFQRQGAEAQRLERRLTRLEFRSSTASGPARIVSRAEPPGSPSSPKPVQNTLIGGIVGLFLAGIAALLLERLDPRLKTPKEAEGALERPILAMVRRSRKLSRVGRKPLRPSDFDEFVALRYQLRYAAHSADLRSVLVTSSAAGDGKTTVAWNLASAAAVPGRKVLLVEADLRNPTLARALKLAPDRGLTDVLIGDASLDAVVQDVAVTSSDNSGSPARVVSVAFAGTPGRISADPRDWERIGALIQESEQDYDLIVVDTAPMLSVPDAVPLLSHVGGVIVIGRLGSTPHAALSRLKEQLESVDAPTVGIVVNSVGRNAVYDYGYGPTT